MSHFFDKLVICIDLFENLNKRLLKLHSLRAALIFPCLLFLNLSLYPSSSLKFTTIYSLSCVRLLLVFLDFFKSLVKLFIEIFYQTDKLGLLFFYVVICFLLIINGFFNFIHQRSQKSINLCLCLFILMLLLRILRLFKNNTVLIGQFAKFWLNFLNITDNFWYITIYLLSTVWNRYVTIFYFFSVNFCLLLLLNWWELVCFVSFGLYRVLNPFVFKWLIFYTRALIILLGLFLTWLYKIRLDP